MAKTPKLKKNAQASSVHSRAARRVLSTLDLDKPTTHLPDAGQRPLILASSIGTRVPKRKPKVKRLSRQQRLRQEKDVERAEATLEKRHIKVQRSLGKGKAIRERRTAWDDLNAKIMTDHKPRRRLEGKERVKDQWNQEKVKDGSGDEIEAHMEDVEDLTIKNDKLTAANDEPSEEEIL